jgi:hypothetical protein
MRVTLENLRDDARVRFWIGAGNGRAVKASNAEILRADDSLDNLARAEKVAHKGLCARADFV